jgi:hypothetical protein
LAFSEIRKGALCPGARSPIAANWPIWYSLVPTSVWGSEAAAALSWSRLVIGVALRNGCTLIADQISSESLRTTPARTIRPLAGIVDGVSRVSCTVRGAGAGSSAAPAGTDPSRGSTAATSNAARVRGRLTRAMLTACERPETWGGVGR